MKRTWKDRARAAQPNPALKVRDAGVLAGRDGRCGACGWEGKFFTNTCPECSARVSA